MVAMRDSERLVSALPPDYFWSGSVTVRNGAARRRQKRACESGHSDEDCCAETHQTPHNLKFFIVKTFLPRVPGAPGMDIAEHPVTSNAEPSFGRLILSQPS